MLTLSGFSRKELRQEASALSEMLRQRTTTQGMKQLLEKTNSTSPSDLPVTVIYTEGKSLAYIAHRLPGVYACTFRVFQEVCRMIVYVVELLFS